MSNKPSKDLAIRKQSQEVREILESQKQRIFEALPKHLNPDRMIRVAMSCIQQNPRLAECTKESFIHAMIECSNSGLEPGGHLGHAYLVPYHNGKLKVYEVKFQPGYKGIIDLCRRSGNISTVSVNSVHEGDKFAYQLGDDERIRHIPNLDDPDRDSKPILYVYATAKLRDGGIQRTEPWSFAKIERHKQQFSKAWQWAEHGDKAKGGGYKDSTWHTNWEAMAKKTVLLQLAKLLPVSIEAHEIIHRAELADAGVETIPVWTIQPDEQPKSNIPLFFPPSNADAEPEPTPQPTPQEDEPTPIDPSAELSPLEASIETIRMARSPRTVKERYESELKKFSDVDDHVELQAARDERLAQFDQQKELV